MVTVAAWVRRHLALTGYLVLAVAVVLAFFATWVNDRRITEARIERLQQLNEVNKAQCRSLKNLYAVIRKTLKDADKAIDELIYYQVYPKERVRAHQRNRKTLAMFKTPPCPKNFRLQPE